MISSGFSVPGNWVISRNKMAHSLRSRMMNEANHIWVNITLSDTDPPLEEISFLQIASDITASNVLHSLLTKLYNRFAGCSFMLEK